MSRKTTRTRLGRAWLIGLVLTALAASPVTELVITGQILYGRAQGASTAAVTDIVRVYNNNPAFMRMRDAGLSETDGARGTTLFEDAKTAANKALASVAALREVDVITTPGGVSGGDDPIDDVTDDVIGWLPVYYVEGQVLQGRSRSAKSIGEVSSDQVLNSIPEYVEWLGLDETDARYHILMKHWNDTFNRVVKKVMMDNQFDAVVELGGTTSRLGPVPDLTQDAIAAL
ncbi:MAG: hypothetical protein H6825_05245 [Planctomycetes bacterium]|nr:hypothetical protein [Planctomycetota bacterium]